jgi:DNA-3-methyladenine glycosylase
MLMGKILSYSFYKQDTRKVAEELLGKLLVRRIGKNRLSGVIVETEAYSGFSDTASHAHKGPTERCKVMYGEGGFAYIYFTYGMYNMFNVVTERRWFPSAVLVRAIEPIEGKEEMFKYRKVKREVELTNGPGKLTQALHIDRSLNGEDLVKGGNIFIEIPNKKITASTRNFKIGKSKRVGIDYADQSSKSRKWRFFIKDNKFISK